MSEPATFRKKPVEIQAIQFTGGNWTAVGVFMGYPRGGLPPTGKDPDGTPWIALTTVHGETAYARPGDWIIPEPVARRFYPCKPDIFAATYEPVDPAGPPAVDPGTLLDQTLGREDPTPVTQNVGSAIVCEGLSDGPGWGPSTEDAGRG